MAFETIVNGTSVIINEQPDSILYVTITIALITLGGIVWSNLQTRKSNKLLEKDIDSRVRPWIILSEAKPRQIIFENTETRYYEDWSKNPKNFPSEIKEITFSLLVKNNGLTPAKNFRKKVVSSHNTFDKDFFKGIDFDPLVITIMPNQEHRINWHVPWKDWINRNSNPLYFGVLAEYEIDDNKTDETGLIVHAKLGGANVIKTW